MNKFYSFALFILLFFSNNSFAQNQTAESFFDQGINFLKIEKYPEALAAFQNSARLDPQNAAAFGNIGVSLLALQRPQESLAAFREAVKIAPGNAEMRAGLCKALSYSQKMTEARAECQKAVSLDENSLAANSNLILISQMEKRPPAEILSAVEKTLQKFPEDANLNTVAAALYAEIGDISRALAKYEKLAQQNPRGAVFQIQLADLYLRSERDAEAIEAARKAIEIDQQNMTAQYFAGKVYFEIGQYEEAAAAFQKVTESKVRLPDAFYFLGVSQARRGKTTEAIAALRGAAELMPDNFRYQKELGITLNNAAQYEAAITPLKAAVKLMPNDFESKTALGVALFESANFEEGIRILGEANQMKPGEQVVNMFLNVARSRQQRTLQIPEMIAFAEENPADLDVRLHLIQHLTYARRINEAAPYFAEIWKINPDDVRVYELIGTLHSTTGNYDKAAEAYRRAIEIGQSPTAYLGLANIYAKKGSVNDAIAAYETLFRLKPDSPNILKIYADFLRDNGKRREALEIYKKSLALLPNNAPALYNAGILSARLGDADSARQYLAMLKTIEPEMAKTLARVIKMRW